MAGLEDTENGAETRRYGATVGLPHGESDGTLVSNAAVQPGDAVSLNGSGEIEQAGSSDTIVGVLVNYSVSGASHREEQIKGNTDATVAVQGTVRARSDGNLSAGDSAGVAASDAGAFGTNDDQGFRVLAVDSSGTDDYIEVVL
jgi:hypothetical protein